MDVLLDMNAGKYPLCVKQYLFCLLTKCNHSTICLMICDVNHVIHGNQSVVEHVTFSVFYLIGVFIRS